MEVIQCTWSEWIEFKEEWEKERTEKPRKIQVKEKKQWQPLAPGCIKFNVSSVDNGGSKQMRLGIIARDDRGQTIQAWSVARDQIQSPVVANVDAVHVALLLAVQNGWDKVKV